MVLLPEKHHGPNITKEKCFKVDAGHAGLDYEFPVLQLRGGGARLQRRGPRTADARQKWMMRASEHCKRRLFASSSAELEAEDTSENTDLKASKLVLWHVNIQGMISSAAELVARLRMSKIKPTIICINETFLDASIGDCPLEGYRLIGRRDRRWNLIDERKCGGVAVYGLTEQADSMTLLKYSPDSERIWILVHTDLGPYLLGAWYRPPVPGEVDSIKSLRKEWCELNEDAIGTVVIGDINIHHRKWLIKSARNSSEGEELLRFCTDFGMQQLVRDATREKYVFGPCSYGRVGLKAQSAAEDS